MRSSLTWPARVMGPAWRLPNLGLGPKALRRLVILSVLTIAALLGLSVWMRAAVALLAMATIMGSVAGRWRWPLLIGLAAGIVLPKSVPNVAMITLGGMFAVEVAEAIFKRRPPSRLATVHWPWIGIILSAGYSILAGRALWSPWVIVKSNFLAVQLAQWSIFALSACAFWVAAAPSRTRGDVRRLTWLLWVLGVVALITDLNPSFGVMSSIFAVNGVVFRICVVATAGAFGLWPSGLSRNVRFGLVSLAFAFPLISFLFSDTWQSGWIPSVGVLITLVLIRLAGISRQVTFYSLMPTLVTVIYLLSKSAVLESWSLGTRLVAWRGLYIMLNGHWLLGLGLASYWHYWRGEIGRYSYLDPRTNMMHFTINPKVNMHNNFIDILGQMGIVGLICVLGLFAYLTYYAYRQLRAESPGFGQAYAAASLGILAGLFVAGMLADWIFPFVYNVTIGGFRDSMLGWLMLGGLVTLQRTREASTDSPSTDGDESYAEAKTNTGRFDKAHHTRNKLLEESVAADQIGLRETVLQLARKLICIVAKENGANAPVASGHEDRAQKAFADGETNLCVRAAGAIVGRRHAE